MQKKGLPNKDKAEEKEGDRMTTTAEDKLKEVSRICNAWENSVINCEEAMDRVYMLSVETGWEEFLKENPQKAKEIEESLRRVEE